MKIKDLFEEKKLRKDLLYTLPPTYVIPELPNSDAYLQYRHSVSLASARSRNDDYLENKMEDDVDVLGCCYGFAIIALAACVLVNIILGVLFRS